MKNYQKQNFNNNVISSRSTHNSQSLNPSTRFNNNDLSRSTRITSNEKNSPSFQLNHNGVKSLIAKTEKPVALNNLLAKNIALCAKNSQPGILNNTRNSKNYSISPIKQIPISKKFLPDKCSYLKKKKTLILDLDETLVHSGFKSFKYKSDMVLKIDLEGKIHDIHVLIRPGAHEFLEKMSLIYELVIFTASLSKYADPLVDRLDPKRLCKYRLFREHCTIVPTEKGVAYVKDLKYVNRDLKETLIIDNNPNSYAVNYENGMPIKTWIDDMKDKELFNYIPILEYLSEVDNIQEVLPKIVTNNEINYNKCFALIKSNIGINNNQNQENNRNVINSIKNSDNNFNSATNSQQDNNKPYINIKIINHNFNNYIVNNNTENTQSNNNSNNYNCNDFNKSANNKSCNIKFNNSNNNNIPSIKGVTTKKNSSSNMKYMMHNNTNNEEKKASKTKSFRDSFGDIQLQNSAKAIQVCSNNNNNYNDDNNNNNINSSLTSKSNINKNSGNPNYLLYNKKNCYNINNINENTSPKFNNQKQLLSSNNNRYVNTLLENNNYNNINSNSLNQSNVVNNLKINENYHVKNTPNSVSKSNLYSLNNYKNNKECIQNNNNINNTLWQTSRKYSNSRVDNIRKNSINNNNNGNNKNSSSSLNKYSNDNYYNKSNIAFSCRPTTANLNSFENNFNNSKQLNQSKECYNITYNNLMRSTPVIQSKHKLDYNCEITNKVDNKYKELNNKLTYSINKHTDLKNINNNSYKLGLNSNHSKTPSYSINKEFKNTIYNSKIDSINIYKINKNEENYKNSNLKNYIINNNNNNNNLTSSISIMKNKEDVFKHNNNNNYKYSCIDKNYLIKSSSTRPNSSLKDKMSHKNTNSNTHIPSLSRDYSINNNNYKNIYNSTVKDTSPNNMSLKQNKPVYSENNSNVFNNISNKPVISPRENYYKKNLEESKIYSVNNNQSNRYFDNNNNNNNNNSNGNKHLENLAFNNKINLQNFKKKGNNNLPIYENKQLSMTNRNSFNQRYGV